MVWVPADTEDAASLRHLISNSDLTHYRALLKSRPVPLNANWRQRGQERINSLRAGSFEIMCEVVRDLTAYGWPKPLRESEAKELHKIQDAVSQEWASALGVLPSVAYREITALLQEGHRIYMPDMPLL
jgi:RNA polymerase-interacting CarD/CdnL/TRCF family regulator